MGDNFAEVSLSLGFVVGDRFVVSQLLHSPSECLVLLSEFAELVGGFHFAVFVVFLTHSDLKLDFVVLLDH